MNFTLYYLAGALTTGVPVIYFVGYLFRRAFMSANSGLLEHLLMTALAGLSAIGFSGFGSGTGGFAARLSHPAEPIAWLAYGFCTVIACVILYLMWDTKIKPKYEAKRTPVFQRAIHILFSVPLIAVGSGNIVSSI